MIVQLIGTKYVHVQICEEVLTKPSTKNTTRFPDRNDGFIGLFCAHCLG